MDVLVVRHGPTEWSRTGRHTGRTDVPLDPAGRALAATLAPVVAAWAPQVVLSSPLARALDTCRLAGCGEGATIDDDLREWDYGADEGRTTPEIRRERPGWTVWRDGPAEGERIEEVAARADRALGRIAALGVDRVAVFSHGHFLRVFAARWLRLPPVTGAHLALDAGTLSLLGHERETPVITRWNVSVGAGAVSVL
ncbi:MAG TPA: histidine phosphatase family protein [Acidimicrobiales bacterium]|nr:histidine phosphatase family protein [Acidimicrobiales bacterium]